MTDTNPGDRAEWMVHLLAFLQPHLKDEAGDRSGAIDAVLLALEAAHSEGLHDAASFCRQVATAAHRHGEVAKALADGIEALAKQAAVAEAARKRQMGS